ncbi:MAG: UvrD-helicase domain-containing protein [Clostridia bacterium]|nr:UvrD-helicase domain-containing protein [Clostridia bacterium]
MKKNEREERAYLESVQEVLTRRVAELEASLDERQKSLMEQRTDMWEDVKHQIRKGGVDEFDEMVEILQQATQMEHDENLHTAELDEWNRYTRMQATPYFGRVDFDDGLGEMEIYVGISTLEDEGEFYVFDWRSPVASLYYENGTGKASYQAPVGTIEGEITLKRQYTIENGALRYYFDTDVEISDGVLREALSQSSDQKLKVIVGTIQKEQNAAIRKPFRKNLLITGPAGCGKTSVGMHRLAWILYENKGKMKVDELAIFTQSELFGAYISGVLPSLGEKETTRFDLEALLEEYLPGLSVESIQDMADGILAGDGKRKNRIERMLDPAFRAELETKINDIHPTFPNVDFFEDRLVNGEDLNERYLTDTGYAPRIRWERIYALVEREVNAFFEGGEADERKPIRKRLADTEEAKYIPMDDLVEETRLKMLAAFRREAEPMVTADYGKTYSGAMNDSERKDFRERRENGKILLEDALNLVWLRLVFEGRLPHPVVRHILVDEAQDYPVLAHMVIKNLFPEADFTLLADQNQGLLPGIHSTENDLAALYGADLVRFERSFRSTTEIAEYAKQFTDAEYDIFTRSGEPVEFKTGDLKTEILAACRAKGEEETLCIVAKSRTQSEKIFHWVRECYPCDLVCGKESRMKEKILVTPVIFTKGLEFDRVVVPEEMFRDDRRSYYMAATRALHKLTVIR